MDNKEVCGVCTETKCMIPVYSKEQTKELVNNKILYGTEVPSTLEDGQVFLLIKGDA